MQVKMYVQPCMYVCMYVYICIFSYLQKCKASHKNKIDKNVIGGGGDLLTKLYKFISPKA